MLVTKQNMMLLFSPCKRCPCPCSDAVLRSCEEALAGIILHRPPSLWGRGPGTWRGEGGGDTIDIINKYIYIYIYDIFDTYIYINVKPEPNILALNSESSEPLG